MGERDVLFDCVGCAVSQGRLVPSGGSHQVGYWWEFHVRMGGVRPAFVLAPMAHVDMFENLPDVTAIELARLLPAVLVAVREHTGAKMVYFAYFNETVPHHAHLHIIPRMATDAVELLGPRLDLVEPAFGMVFLPDVVERIVVQVNSEYFDSRHVRR